MYVPNLVASLGSTAKDSGQAEMTRRPNAGPSAQVNVRAEDDWAFSSGLSVAVVYDFAEAASLAGPNRTRVTPS